MSNKFAYVTCEGCGKRGYYSKKTAKKEMSAHSMGGMCVYRCKLSQTELWHWGHLPPTVKDGRWARADLGSPARRIPRRGRAPG